MTTEPNYILMCEDHKRPLETGGFCPICRFCPDMQSTYLIRTDSEEAKRLEKTITLWERNLL